MFKRFLLISTVFTILILVTACSNDTDPIEDKVVEPITTTIIVTIIDISDEPNDNWFGLTTLVEGQYGRMIFSHEHLEDIGATVGDVVEITTTGVWMETDPIQLHIDSWSFVE